ncbi:hypothetical protein [Sorangium sp. So ce1151]|uniref:hypothetical protein n=1 Tax=Sorangium sp. So ce1151 TaxID=3133332 RepID=UPI003F5EAA88
MNADLGEVNRRKARFEITKKGLAYLGEIIDDAETLVDELDDESIEDAVAELRRRNVDVLRAWFLWAGTTASWTSWCSSSSAGARRRSSRGGQTTS